MLWHIMRMMLFCAGVFVLMLAAVAVSEISTYFFGTSIPALALYILGLFLVLAWLTARSDIAEEDRRNERLMDRLRKD
jgi:hypothetical protein